MTIDEVREINATLEARGIFAGQLRVAITDDSDRVEVRGARVEGLPGVRGVVLAGPTTALEGATAFLHVEMRDEAALAFIDASVPGWRD